MSPSLLHTEWTRLAARRTALIIAKATTFSEDTRSTDMPPDGGQPSETMFDSYMAALGNRFDSGTQLLPGPTSAKENSAMNKLTNWDVHLEKWLRDKGSATALRSVMKLTGWRKRHAGVDRLSRIVQAYELVIRSQAHNCSLRVRSMLEQYPRTDNHGTPWKPLELDDTLQTYATLLVDFALAILRTESADSPTTYRLPLTAFEKKHVADYYLALTSQIPQSEKAPATAAEIERFHSFITVFLLKRRGGNITEGQGKFDLPLECLCAIWSVDDHGRLRDARGSTKLLAMLKYLIRGTILFEANLQRAASGALLESAIESIAEDNLHVNALSPYNVIVDLQRAVSSVAYLSVDAPTMRVSQDMDTFYHADKILHLPKFVDGLRRGIVEVQTRLDKLLFGMRIPYKIPSVVADDWPCKRRGYSFLSANTFHAEQRPYVRGLMDVTELSIGRRDAAGKFMLNVAAVTEVLRRDEHFLEWLLPALFICASFARGAEFADHKHANGTLPRTIFMNGTDLWLVTRRAAQDPTEVFVPVLVPPVLANILLHYLIIVRPAITELVWATRGEEAGILYSEYLWVFNGRRMTEGRVSSLLEMFTRQHCDVELSVRPFRQFQVAILRSRLGSEAEVEDENHVFAAMAGHSPQKTGAHYAKEFNHLPFLSSDLLRRHHRACLLMHEVLGLHSRLSPMASIDARRRTRDAARAMVTSISPTAANQPAARADTSEADSNS
ncbi:hypothetical protein DFH06DRAFT_1407112 [Mycena polygramma]|nr:hypothetical protein DFH06DRAFT_1407112 [Mycena polygramma]